MTSLLIGYPDIPMRGAGVKTWATNSTTETPNQADDYQGLNCYQGLRQAWWQSSYSKSEHNIRWDLGSGNTRAASFIVLARVDALRALYPTTTTQFELMRSTDDSAWTTEQTIANLHSLTLTGPSAQDYISTFSATSAYRYWRAKISSTAGTADFTSRISKIYLGNLFDFGVEPAMYKIERDYQFAEDFISGGGVRHTGRLSAPRYKVALEWWGVSDATTKAFFDDINARRNTHTFFLYTASYHDVLDEARLLHVRLVSASSDDTSDGDYNRVTAEFLEVLG
jgi:hypothetical protein